MQAPMLSAVIAIVFVLFITLCFAWPTIIFAVTAVKDDGGNDFVPPALSTRTGGGVLDDDTNPLGFAVDAHTHKITMQGRPDLANISKTDPNYNTDIVYANDGVWNIPAARFAVQSEIEVDGTGTDVQTGVYKIQREVGNSELCQTVCQTDPYCKMFEYDSESLMCKLSAYPPRLLLARFHDNIFKTKDPQSPLRRSDTATVNIYLRSPIIKVSEADTVCDCNTICAFGPYNDADFQMDPAGVCQGTLDATGAYVPTCMAVVADRIKNTEERKYCLCTQAMFGNKHIRPTVPDYTKNCPVRYVNPDTFAYDIARIHHTTL